MHAILWFRLEDQISDHTILCIFLNEIIAQKGYESLLKKINKKLEKTQAILKTVVIINANITVRLLAPKVHPTSVVEDQKEEA
ncbi:MAG: hypothetical protein ACMUEL_04245 [Flavobacteriales bacterium Tduv]